MYRWKCPICGNTSRKLAPHWKQQRNGKQHIRLVHGLKDIPVEMIKIN